MKKLLIIVCTFLLFGCSMNKTPSSEVDRLFLKYTNLDNSVVSELNDYLTDKKLTEYKDVYLRQYEDLEYVIKNERIDGSAAIVTVQITVYDYYKVLEDANNYISLNSDEFRENNIYSSKIALDYKVKSLKKTNDRVSYTLDLSLTKTTDGWMINTLTSEEIEKIHGLYAH